MQLLTHIAILATIHVAVLFQIGFMFALKLEASQVRRPLAAIKASNVCRPVDDPELDVRHSFRRIILYSLGWVNQDECPSRFTVLSDSHAVVADMVKCSENETTAGLFIRERHYDFVEFGVDLYVADLLERKPSFPQKYITTNSQVTILPCGWLHHTFPPTNQSLLVRWTLTNTQAGALAVPKLTKEWVLSTPNALTTNLHFFNSTSLALNTDEFINKSVYPDWLPLSHRLALAVCEVIAGKTVLHKANMTLHYRKYVLTIEPPYNPRGTLKKPKFNVETSIQTAKVTIRWPSAAGRKQMISAKLVRFRHGVTKSWTFSRRKVVDRLPLHGLVPGSKYSLTLKIPRTTKLKSYKLQIFFGTKLPARITCKAVRSNIVLSPSLESSEYSVAACQVVGSPAPTVCLPKGFRQETQHKSYSAYQNWIYPLRPLNGSLRLGQYCVSAANTVDGKLRTRSSCFNITALYELRTFLHEIKQGVQSLGQPTRVSYKCITRGEALPSSVKWLINGITLQPNRLPSGWKVLPCRQKGTRRLVCRLIIPADYVNRKPIQLACLASNTLASSRSQLFVQGQRGK